MTNEEALNVLACYPGGWDHYSGERFNEQVESVQHAIAAIRELAAVKVERVWDESYRVELIDLRELTKELRQHLAAKEAECRRLVVAKEFQDIRYSDARAKKLEAEVNQLRAELAAVEEKLGL